MGPVSIARFKPNCCVPVMGHTHGRLEDTPTQSIRRGLFGEQLSHLTVTPLNVFVFEHEARADDRRDGKDRLTMAVTRQRRC
jgi:hypothetical protein